MAEEALELSVAGTRVRVVSSASAEELTPLVDLVEEKLNEVSRPGRPITKESMMLAAIALANEVMVARQETEATKAQSKATLQALLGKLDRVLETSEAPARARAGRRSRKGRSSSAGRTDGSAGRTDGSGGKSDGASLDTQRTVAQAAGGRQGLASVATSKRAGKDQAHEATPQQASPQEQVAASQRPAEKRQQLTRASRASDRPNSSRD